MFCQGHDVVRGAPLGFQCGADLGAGGSLSQVELIQGHPMVDDAAARGVLVDALLLGQPVDHFFEHAGLDEQQAGQLVLGAGAAPESVNQLAA